MLHIKKLKPLLTNILTTGDKYEEDMYANGLVSDVKGTLKLYQKVLAVGPVVRDIKVGDMVMIDPRAYAVMKYDKNSIQNDLDNNKRVKWELPWITVDDEKGNPQECLLLTDRDIRFVFEGEEKNEKIMIPNKKLMVN